MGGVDLKPKNRRNRARKTKKIREKRSATHFSSTGNKYLRLLCVHLFFPSEVRLGFIKLLREGGMQPSLINQQAGGKDPL
jgi:hypothetical protein